MREAQNLAVDIGARETRYDASTAYKQKIVRTHADVLAEVRRVIEVSIGPALAKAYVTQSLIKQAIEKGVSGDSVSVLILGAGNEHEAAAYQAAWPSRSSTPHLPAGAKPSAEDVNKLYDITRKTKK